jgi:glycosyltransferase involved in cell wall biosynthesis
MIVEALPLLREALGAAVSLHLVGPIDAGYGDRLRDLARAKGCGDEVVLEGPVPHAAVVDHLAGATVAVSASATGSIDKAVLEAMACGVPVVVANAAFGFLPEECRCSAEPRSMATKVAALASAAPEERAALGTRLRTIVEDGHSLERLADLLLADVLVRAGDRR